MSSKPPSTGAMNRLGLSPLKVGSLTVEVVDVGDSVAVVLRGDADAREAGPELDAYLVGAVHPAVLQAGLRELRLDVTGLEFLNSAGIKALVNWLLAIKQQPPAQRYVIVLDYDEGITWQGKGLKPLACVAPSFLRLHPLS
ncbi:MAG: hypothetical protein RMK29_09125 [Myxococcales bacterium]|nr:hypothetical protein [Myxococcota bacterium]MDW8281860.1 hypothetical protein [Myxococcales bacterium]